MFVSLLNRTLCGLAYIIMLWYCGHYPQAYTNLVVLPLPSQWMAMGGGRFCLLFRNLNVVDMRVARLG